MTQHFQTCGARKFRPIGSIIAIRDVKCPTKAMQTRMQDVKSVPVLCLAESLPCPVSDTT